MSYDVVALVARNPSVRAIARSLQDAGPELKVRPLANGNILQLRDVAGRVLATLEPGQLVESREEVARLLGEEAAIGMPDTCWWVELRARPDDAGREAAHRVADGLALRLGGTVWTSGPADLSAWQETEHPAVEFTTAEAFVVAQDREVVPLSSWLSDAMSTHAARGTALQLLTPATSRLTYSLRTLLTHPMARWVVRADDGTHFDGISGLPLRRHPEHAYVPAPPEEGAPEPAAGFLDDSPMGAHLVVDLSVRHQVPFSPPLGRAVEIVADHLAGTLPAGWGPHEPALVSWERERLVRLARHRAPRPSAVQFSGPYGTGSPFTGGIRVSWDGERGAERISMVLGHENRDALPLDALPGMVEALAAEGLLDVLHVRRARGRLDVTYEPRWHGLAVPVGMAIGPDGVGRTGVDHALSGPLEGTLLGRGPHGPGSTDTTGTGSDTRAVWYPIPGDDERRQRSMEAVGAQLRHLTSAVPPSA